jgi:crossover junction endodeoxyribonuclease RusA
MSNQENAVLFLMFPDPALSPNAKKKHWTYRQDAKETAKENAFVKAREIDVDLAGKNLQATLTFFPPDKKRRDLDNLLASMKPDLDGICLGLHVDDSAIKRITVEWGEVDPGKEGKVIVILGPM